MSYRSYIQTFSRPNGENFRIWNKWSNSLHEDLLKLTEDEIASIEASWKETQKENQKIREEMVVKNKEAIREVEDFFKKFGMRSYKIKNGKILGKYKEFSEFCDKVNKMLPLSAPHYPSTNNMLVGNETIRPNFSPNNIGEIVKYAKKSIEQIEQKKKNSNKLLIVAASLAHKYGIDPLSENLIELVREANLKEFINNNYPDGSEVSIDFCDGGCNTWTVGERRCSCGNRRVYLETDGDINNWFVYPMPY